MVAQQQQHLARAPPEGEGGDEQVGLAEGDGWRMTSYGSGSDDSGEEDEGSLSPRSHVAARL